MPKPGWDPPVSVLSKDWSIYGNDAKRLLSWDDIQAFPYQKSLRTKKIKEFVPTRKQAGRKTLSKECIKFSAAKNGKRPTDTQNLTQKDFLFQ